MGMYTDIHPVLECDLNQLVDKRSTLKLFARSLLYILIQLLDLSPPDQVHGNPYNYKEYKKEKRLTQQTLADQIDVTSSVISKWENGKGFPDI